jgi:hypothetical protein
MRVNNNTLHIPSGVPYEVHISRSLFGLRIGVVKRWSTLACCSTRDIRTGTGTTCCALFVQIIVWLKISYFKTYTRTYDIYHFSNKILLRVQQLLGNGLINKFPRRQVLRKHSVAMSRNNKTNTRIYSSLLGNNQRANGLARLL